MFERQTSGPDGVTTPALARRASGREPRLSARGASTSRSPALRRALAHVERHYAQRITLDDLAAVAAQTPFALIRAFRRELGITPHACIVRLRLAVALRLLEAGESVSAAAAEAGFSDQAHLTRHFKRAHGSPPRRYLAAQAVSRPDAGAGRPSAG